MVSFGVSHGSIFGCCLKSVNHEQPVSAAVSRSAPSRRVARSPSRPVLALTPHLRRPVLLQDVLGLVSLIGARFDPHAEMAAREPRIIANGHGEAWNVSEREHGEH